MRTIASGTTAFDRAVDQVRAVVVRPEFRIEEVPAPQRLAPAALALTVERVDVDDDAAYGRFVLLHDPDGVDEWEGTFRAVVFIRAELEPDMVDDPMVQDVAWSWLEDCLSDAEISPVHVGGTVTRTSSASFGSMSDRPADGFVEIRASWTPSDDEPDVGAHVRAWIGLLAHASGLAPLPDGVAHVGARRRRSSADR